MLLSRNVTIEVNNTKPHLKELHNDEEIDSINRLKFFIPMPSEFETYRLFIRRVYKSYLYYNPEIKMFNCMVKYARTQYPDFLRYLRVEDLKRTGRSLHMVFVKLLDNLMNGGGIGFYDTEIDRYRVAWKIAQMAAGENLPPETDEHYNGQQVIQLNTDELYTKPITDYSIPNTARTFQESHIQRGFVQKNQNNVTNLLQDEPMIDNEMKESERTIRRTKRQYVFNDGYMYSEPYIANPFDSREDMAMDPDARIDLTRKPVIEESNRAFTIESMVLRSLGIDPNSVKKWSPTYCTKEYVKDLITRFTKTILLA